MSHPNQNIQGRSQVGTTVEAASLRRLQLATLFIGISCLVGTALVPFTDPNSVGARAGHVRPFWVLPTVASLAIGMYLMARWKRMPTARRLDMGLVWLFALCVLASIYRHDLPYEDFDVVRGVSLVPYGLLLYAALVPTRPTKLLVTAILCSLADFAVFLILGALGTPLPKTEVWIWLFSPNVVGLVLAVATANVVYSLGKSLETARELGSYKLVERLGAGGMGEVWLAEHHTLARPAAIKLIRSDLAPDVDIVLRERFLEEAQAIARLESPHTVALYDFGVNPHGVLFYVMEHLTGLDLETLLREEKRLPPSRTAWFLRQACLSLSEAHAADLVHRDLKPANLFVCQRGLEVDVLKVLDFGLVHIVGENTTQIGGTPGYIAPETLSGNVTPLADIYALGCIAYTCLVGSPPFNGFTVEEVLQAHLEGKPVDIRTAAQQAVPTDFADLIMQCIALQPEDRPGSCAELLERLEACGLEWTNADASAWWTEHPVLPSPVEPISSQQRATSETVFSLF